MKAKSANILLVEDDQDLRQLLLEELEAESYQVTACSSAEQAQELLQQHRFDLLVSDLRLPQADGLSLVPFVQQRSQPPAMLIITAFGTVSQAVAALQLGVDDFITKPLDMEHFLLTVKRLIESRLLQEELQQYRRIFQQEPFFGIVGESAAISQLTYQIKQIGPSDAAVLIQGESGTGKELIAKALHQLSDRKDQPYVVVNCGGIPSELMESEFFGHAAGAFTGAKNRRAGLFQQASGGTLLLDELGEMPLALQAKLLRVLQEGKIRPVGSDHEVAVDVRVIAATNRDLLSEVAQGNFREDLFYRLETFNLIAPPLRQREGDLKLLVEYFLARFNNRQQKRIKGLTDLAWQALSNYPFPGNVRELQNAIERAATFCDGAHIDAKHLPPRIFQQVDVSELLSELEAKSDSAALPSLAEVQQRYVHTVLNHAGGNKKKAAQILGVTRRTLYRWLEEK